jgi:hypothetical protein
MEKDKLNKLLHMAGLNKKEFAEISKIAYPTVAGWGASRKGKVLEIPNWVEPFIYYYIRSKQLDYISNEICQKLQEIKE